MNINCTCGNYESYGSRCNGMAVAAMMPFDACVNCYQEELDTYFVNLEAESQPKDLQARLKEFKEAKRAK